MKKILAMALVAAMIAGCNNPKDSVIPSDLAKLDELKEPMQKLSEGDRAQLAAYLMRTRVANAMSGAGPEIGVTIGDALKRQKTWLDEQKKQEDAQALLKVKLLADQDAIRKKIDAAVTVTVLSKKLVAADFNRQQFSDSQEFKIGIANLTGKDIAGVKGRVVFYDIFGKEAGGVGFSFDEGIKANQTATWQASRKYNQFIDEHRTLAALEEGKYTTKFEPEMIIFAGGTKLVMPE